MARMVVTAPEYTKNKYDLPKLKEIEEYVASVVEVNIPFNNPITGFCVRYPNASLSLHPLTIRRLSRIRLVFTLRVRIDQLFSYLFSPELTFYSYSGEPLNLRGKSYPLLITRDKVSNT